MKPFVSPHPDPLHEPRSSGRESAPSDLKSEPTHVDCKSQIEISKSRDRNVPCTRRLESLRYNVQVLRLLRFLAVTKSSAY